MTINIDEVRTELLGTLKDLRNREKPMEPDRARAIAQVASVLVDSARVEVEYLKAINGDESEFLKPKLPAPAAAAQPQLPDDRTHRLR